MKEFNLSKITLAVLLLMLCCLNEVVLSQDRPTSSPNEKREAEKAWESLIRAKGGREKLHSINNMLAEFLDMTRLSIFPNREWKFGYRIGTGEPNLSLYDGTVWYYAGKDGINETRHEDLGDYLKIDYIPFLLETKNYKPTLLRVTRVNKGKKKFDVIETMIGEDRIDFVFEPEEMLVSRVDFHDKKGEIWKSYALSDYTEIDGIKMPRTFGLGGGYRKSDKEKFVYMPIKFTFNVKYDPHLFELPFRATTPDSWKSKP